MRKMLRTLVFGIVIATPLLLAPHQSKAGNLIGDLLKDLFGNNNNQGQNNNNQGNQGNPNCATNPSVPLNEGTVFLLIAGLGLGVKMIYDRRKQVENSVI
jgi:hypothetical protein